MCFRFSENSEICVLEFMLDKANKKIYALQDENGKLLQENKDLKDMNSFLMDSNVDLQKTVDKLKKASKCIFLHDKLDNCHYYIRLVFNNLHSNIRKK